MSLLDRFNQDRIGFGLAVLLAVVHCCWGALLALTSDGLGDWFQQWVLRPESTVGLVKLGALSKGELWIDGEYWRSLSSFFVHGSVVHLALNVSALLALTPVGRRLFGGAVVLVGLLACGTVGASASALWGDGLVAVGASGGIFGLAGAIWVRLWLGGGAESVDEEIDVGRLGWALVASLLLGWAVGLLDLGFRIDQVGHVGGLCLGLLWGLADHRRVPRLALGSGLTVAALAGLSAPPLIGSQWASNSTRLELALQRVERGAEQRGLEELLELGSIEFSPDQWNDAGYRLVLAGKGFGIAEAFIEKALAVRPDDPNFLDSLGWLECLTGRSSEGLAHLRDAASGFGIVPEEVSEHLRDCESVAQRP